MKASALKRAEAFSFAGIPACLWEILAFCPHLKKSHRNPSGFSASLKTGKFFPAFENAVEKTRSPVVFGVSGSVCPRLFHRKIGNCPGKGAGQGEGLHFLLLFKGKAL